MKVLLRRTVPNLGIVGDVVEVSAGYARNYLLPERLAIEPTEANIRQLAEARRVAELERAAERARMEGVAQRLAELEVTIPVKANAEGVLYGSVGPREIAAALNAEGHDVTAEQVVLKTPIRHLDNVKVEVKLLPEVVATVKVWVVRERGEEAGATEEPPAEGQPAAKSEHPEKVEPHGGKARKRHEEE
ncbi:MAG TPA: 50S ribosomal protein L9 [Phycisphaerae bacterium]|nr:50S ribosomal protein L9 [Phycisphaerae bacterium]HNU45244.1 50S ribosomal protein L9 [Phycisphaerae bacterium]